MPDENGNLLPPIEDKCFDGDKQSVELKFPKCKHEFYLKSPTEVRCKKCTAGWTGTPSEIKNVFGDLTR